MSKALLTIEGLVKNYGMGPVLNGIDLTVHEGEVLVILGPSGCGKSTLLRCINALEPIQSGTITLDGEPVSRDSKNLPALRRKVGMVFQSYELFPHLTVLDNITLAPRKAQGRDRAEAEAEALSLLERVGLKDRAHDFPRQLSGGAEAAGSHPAGPGHAPRGAPL